MTGRRARGVMVPWAAQGRSGPESGRGECNMTEPRMPTTALATMTLVLASGCVWFGEGKPPSNVIVGAAADLAPGTAVPKVFQEALPP